MRSIITWHYVVHIWGQYYHVTLTYEVNIITWHYVVHTMRSILSRDIMFSPHIITWHYVVHIWGQYYHVTLCCSHYEVNIITWHYVVHTMRSILSRDIMLFPLWGQYYHVTLCCSQYEVKLSRDIMLFTLWGTNIITWHYVVSTMRSRDNIITWTTLCCSLIWGQHYHVICFHLMRSRDNIITWHYVTCLPHMNNIISRVILTLVETHNVTW